MAGAEAQAGFYYQNLVAAEYALNLIEFGSSLQSLTFDNPGRAKYIDDIIIESNQSTIFVQVKWSQDDDSAFTLHNLVTPEEDSPSLLEKLAKGYRTVASTIEKVEIILLSTRKPGTNRQQANGFDKSLTEFISEFHEPFANATDIQDIRNAGRFNEYQSVLSRLLAGSGLTDLEELSKFLKCLRFRLDQPNRDTTIEKVRAHLVRLGIEQIQYATLIDEIIKWSISGQKIYREDVLRVLGLLDHFVDRVSHSFPVDRSVWVPTPELFKALDASIGTLDNGFILLEGEPGIGKSTALTMYLSHHPDVKFGYFCFVPLDRAIGNERVGDQAFVRSICIGLKNAFPDIDYPNPFAPYTVHLLNEWLRALSRTQQRIVFVVDGLDHVDRKTRQSLVAQPLTTVLDGDLPHNVVIVLSSRYPEALPVSIQQHIRDDPRRHVQMPRFELPQVRTFFQLRGVGLAETLLESVLTTSGGVPIYLEYLADRLARMSHYEQERFLKDVPILRDKKIDSYHQHLWEICRKNESIIYILAILAARNEFTAPETLYELLRLVNINTSLNAVCTAINEVQHVLRISDARSVAIRHSSLSEFISERTENIQNQINSALLQWYSEHSDSDEAWRHQFRHLLQAGKNAEILTACDDSWLSRAWVKHRPINEIQENLNIAWQAASENKNLLDFIRVALMKQRVALIRRNLDLSENQFAQLLLDMGYPDEALRRVWDGERRQCGSVAFARFALHHLDSTGRLFPKHILLAGLGDGPDPDANTEDVLVWYRTKCLLGNAVELLNEIKNIHWITKNPHGLLKERVAHEDNIKTNLELQLAVIFQLLDHRDLESLDKVRQAESLEDSVRTAAQVAYGITLAHADEIAQAARELRGLNLQSIPNPQRLRLALSLSEYKLNVALLPLAIDPPLLPNSLMSPEGQHLNGALFNLYDQLRLFFLSDNTAFPWFESSSTGLEEPAKTCISAIGHLARIWDLKIRESAPGTPTIESFQKIIIDLDLRTHHFDHDDHQNDFLAGRYQGSVHRIYEHVWSCATQALSKNQLTELAQWWARADGGNRAIRYREATLSLARIIHKHVIESAEIVRELIGIAERDARSDEETSAMVPALVTCASAFGICGFPQDAERLWSELLDIGCGANWRKDYQFNEILVPIRLAHEQEPTGTLTRIQEQLLIAHGLIGNVQSRTVAIAIEGLIEFLAKVDPRLALRALVQEENQISRERALRKTVSAFLKNRSLDRRFIVAIVETMSRWENYSDFNEETNPTMFAVYETSLQDHDFALAGMTYELWREVLLVEKELPSELRLWADEWIRVGNPPPNVLRDHDEYPAPVKNTSSPLDSVTPSAEDVELSGVLDQLAASSLVQLEKKLDETLNKEIRKDRQLNLERIYPDVVKALVRASGREWSPDETKEIEDYFKLFSEVAVTVPTVPGAGPRENIRTLLRTFFENASSKLSCQITIELFENFFDLDQWLDGFIRSGMSSYSLERIIEARLPTWIAAAPPTTIDTWEDFCRRRCTGDARAAGLFATAERRSIIAPDVAVANLIEAWQSAPEFFHERGRSSLRICGKLLELDNDRGCELLLESFRLQYQRYPESIVYRLENLLEFNKSFLQFDATRLYDIWAAHNRRLAAGLSDKPVDLSWVTEPLKNNFQSACLDYLIELFKYPVVDVRHLAFDATYRLLCERTDLIEPLLASWPDLDNGQREYLATILFSLGVMQPETAQHWAASLVALVQKEMHYNLRVITAEAVHFVASRGVSLSPEVIVAARALQRPPLILVALPSIVGVLDGRNVRFPPYLDWAKDMMAAVAKSGELDQLTGELLARVFPNWRDGVAIESAVHRNYNINSNFDAIEISGDFDRACREALNSAVQGLVASQSVDHDALTKFSNVLRLKDPTDILIRKISRPPNVSWIDDNLSDAEFNAFADIDRLKSEYRYRDGDWLTVFEHSEQRTDGRVGASPKRANVIRVMVFGLPPNEKAPTLADLADDLKAALKGHLNLFRFELSDARPILKRNRFMPLVVISRRAFRGRHSVDQAALLPELVGNLTRTPFQVDPFGFFGPNGTAARSIEWQEAFDQGRRRHEPRSKGFLLQMSRELLKNIASAIGIELWVYLKARRSTDRYKPEYEMVWEEHEDIFPLW